MQRVLTGEPAGTQPAKTKVRVARYSGPLPPPSLLQDYEDILPGSAERIFNQFEKQGGHRRKLENRVVWYNVFSGTVGQVMGFLLFGGGIAGSIFLLYNDKAVTVKSRFLCKS